MPTTMNLIAKQTVGSGGAASVTFSSIPQTFTDLKLVCFSRSNVSQVYEIVRLNFNGLTTNQSSRWIEGSGSGVSSATSTRIDNFGTGNTATASTFASTEFYIPNYTSSNNKSVSGDGVGENNATFALSGLFASLWSSTAAITSIEVKPQDGSAWLEFSEFTLYGISNNTTTQNTTTPSAIGGDVITTDGTYWYHQFLYSGTFTPLKNLTCDYLVVAGGGSGGSKGRGGGGGAGGYRTSIGGSPLSLLANTAYTAQIGAGAAGRTTEGQGLKGGNSVFSSITSTGGGGGGRGNDTGGDVGATGGSGGGGGSGNGLSGAGGAGNQGGFTPVEGYAGGNGSNTSSGFGAGGGGGASQVGFGGSGSGGGAGGAGTANSITGSSVTYAGGGGGATNTGSGGAGGAGGGGAGGDAGTPTGTAGTANTGGGGGGAYASTSSAGGSGIIIIRYAV
jgi:hypothetical protein